MTTSIQISTPTTIHSANTHIGLPDTSGKILLILHLMIVFNSPVAVLDISGIGYHGDARHSKSAVKLAHRRDPFLVFSHFYFAYPKLDLSLRHLRDSSTFRFCLHYHMNTALLIRPYHPTRPFKSFTISPKKTLNRRGSLTVESIFFWKYLSYLSYIWVTMVLFCVTYDYCFVVHITLLLS
jgi:hypothetical protein